LIEQALDPLHDNNRDASPQSTSSETPSPESREVRTDLRHSESNLTQPLRKTSKQKVTKAFDPGHLTAPEIFTRVSVNQSISRDDIKLALNMLGYRRPKSEWVKHILFKECGDGHNLDEVAFGKFCAAYAERFSRHMADVFSKAGNGSLIQDVELRDLLRSEGFEALPAALQEIIEEVSDNSDTCHGLPINVSFEDFLLICNRIIDRAGLTRADLAKVKKAYSRVNSSRGYLGMHQVCAGLKWLGFPVDIKLVSSLLAGDSANTNVESVNLLEFCGLVRKYREQEATRAISAAWLPIQPHKDRVEIQPHKDRVDTNMLPCVFQVLGYKAASPKVIQECLETCWESNLSYLYIPHRHRRSLWYEDLIALLECYRGTGGLLKAETQEFINAFSREIARQSDRTMGPVGAARALCWCGFPATIWSVQDSLENLGAEPLALLDVETFRRLGARMHLEDMSHLSHKIGTSQHGDNSDARLSLDMLCRIFSELGYELTPEQQQQLEIEAGSPQAEVGIWTALELLRSQRAREQAIRRTSKGFCSIEVARFQAWFAKHCNELTQTCNVNQVATYLGELLPEENSSRHRKKQARDALQAGVHPRNGSLSMLDFLTLLRKIRDWASNKQLEKEACAVERSGFKWWDVKKIRDVLRALNIDWSNDLKHIELDIVLRKIIPNANQILSKSDIKALIASACPKGSTAFSFGDLLALVRSVMDESGGDIIEGTTELQKLIFIRRARLLVDP